MNSDQAVDRHLQAVFAELITAVYVTKQLVRSAPAERREQLQDLLTFLVEQSHLVDEAEARIDGRGTTMAAPSSHERRNLLGDVGNDVEAALALYAERVDDLAAGIRRRAAEMGDRSEAQLLVEIAEGLQRRVLLLRDGA